MYGVQLQYQTCLNSHVFFMFNKATRTIDQIKLQKNDKSNASDHSATLLEH